MKKWIKYSLISVGSIAVLYLLAIVVSLILFIMPTNDRDNNNPEKQIEMIAITQEWGRLDSFPVVHDSITIFTEGNSFTRTFRGSFSSNSEDIQIWMNNSEGFQDARIETITETKKRYIITAGGGANFAEVIIDFETGFVEFRVSWS